MEQFLFHERVAVKRTGSSPRPHLSCLDNGKGKHVQAKTPRRRMLRVKKRDKEAKPSNHSFVPVNSAPSAGPESVDRQAMTIATCDMDTTSHKPPRQTWSERQGVEDDHWEGVRGALFDDAVSACAVPTDSLSCAICSNPATVICRTCPSSVFCTECDINQHTLQPFHKRRHWTHGFWQTLPATASIMPDGHHVHFDPVMPLHGCTSVCLTCARDTKMGPAGSTICITMQGRFDLRLPVWSCASCKIRREVTNFDLVQHGFYRASPVMMSTVVHEDVFVAWQNLKYHSPGTSLMAFVSTLEALGNSYGSAGPVDFERLEKAYTEWACLQFELQRLTGSDYMTCEACGPEPRMVHVDGNFKLYRYQSSGSGELLSAYHRGTLIEDKEAVDAHISKTQVASKTGNRCGVSSWTAGRNNTGRLQSKKSQDETGLVVATCRHSVVLGGVNMYRGELFAYSHYLQQKRFPNLQYFASDIVCKYWPWSQRVGQLYPEHDTRDTKPFLSVMHATSHAYYCQITYGGFWQEGSGWAVMETTEIANALLSRASNTTKYMTSAQRIDAITDLALCYNRVKHHRMPELLAKRKEDAMRRLPRLQAKLEHLLEEHGVDASQVNAMITQLRLLAKSLSKRDTRGTSGTALENAIEIVSDSWRMRRSAVQNIATSAKMRAASRKAMTADHRRLEKLLNKYQRETGVAVDMADAEEGCFPWHSHPAAGSRISLSAQRAICDAAMRTKRTEEELVLVHDEMQRLLSASENTALMLLQPLELVEEQLSLPEDQRQLVVHSPPSADRYCISNQSASVLRGLRSLISEALNYRQEYLQFARARLQHLMHEAVADHLAEN